jgi:hypothetical protein
MDYVRVMEAFVGEQLARSGWPSADRSFTRARVLFRRPCFTGEWYRRKVRRFVAPDGDAVLIGAIIPVAGPDAPADGRPATVVQLIPKKSLQSGGAWDKGP